MKPYALPTSRARALYGIPTAPKRNRALELCCRRDPLLLGCSWPGESHTVCKAGPGNAPDARATHATVRHVDYAMPLPFEPGSFELIVLHRTLDDLRLASRRQREEFDAGKFLSQLAGLLVPGGVVAGCVGNAGSPKRIKRMLAQRGIDAATGSPPFLTMRSCGRLLQMSGFADIRLFSLLPDCDDPLKLIELTPTVSRFGFRQEFEGRRDQMPALSYWMRRFVAGLGLYPYFEESIFFWAYKPC
jgi:SAM-dependent methyltransferase